MNSTPRRKVKLTFTVLTERKESGRKNTDGRSAVVSEFAKDIRTEERNHM